MVEPISLNECDEVRKKELMTNVKKIQEEVQNAAQGRNVRLVAVSKLKPASDILGLYEGIQHLHFGENYVSELVEKAKLLPQDIKWHFIGALQTNKCKILGSIPNLFAVETVDTIKKAEALNKSRSQLSQTSCNPIAKLKIYIQINTSNELNKSGIKVEQESIEDTSELILLSNYIKEDCESLELSGLMTIGSFKESTTDSDFNEDFHRLIKIRNLLEDKIGIKPLGLSMGMSSDFSLAIRMGSDNVRVGSKIFGERPPFKPS
ncbi:uncharacterized protein MELLADRAFT_62402 [Melampsora larici-populina 98AG31]|uniref:Pyridoxal phosphate homeostasis protein n=1 Tax=Melampsora larici-populina (strain 98AG31 / pathotype 3-4-7) TaxID=747676 RepID=F4RIU6_MELLP|nr:uncharacterized protein MELLADRAFT_62402 [Melampsora larici-populina 98AG31]EGG07625.1 hypothetical protein MELLADRAFT_62402 [Melampsora larici-populina 98AG31]